MPLRIHKHPQISTRNSNGSINGFLIPIYNINDGFITNGNEPQQVYLTVCDVGQIKGPHLHKKRWGYFTCIRGDIRIIVRNRNSYEEYFSGENHEFATVEIPPGIPAAIQNIADEPSYVINIPSPAWHIDDQDEHQCEFDKSVFVWSYDK